MTNPHGDLHKIAARHRTDKNTNVHTFGGRSYLDTYELYLSPLRELPIHLLEIGVRFGGSMRMWKEYFPAAQIYGMDIRPDAKEHEEDRISIVIGPQEQKVATDAIVELGAPFDVIIDDGSHVNIFTLAAFHALFPHLRSGGTYIIEDMRPTYHDLERMGIRHRWHGGPWMDKNVNISNNRGDLMRFFGEKLKDLDFGKGEIRSIQFWSQLCIITKL